MTLPPDQLEQMLLALPPRSLRKTIFGFALAYSSTATLALNSVHASGNADYCAPAIVCQSFAIELLLKFLIINDHPHGKTFQQLKNDGMTFGGVRGRGLHGYTALFDQLSVETKGKLVRAYTDISGINTSQEEFGAALVSSGEEPFVKWRYIYEGTSMSNFHPLKIASVLQALGEVASAELQLDPN